MTAVSLFAGVGGFDLALQRAGVRVTAAVEIDPKARAVLARQFPSTTLFSDVQEVTGHELRATGFIPERGIITGGFPCQDLSVAGRREGLAGARSGLFWEIVRLLDDLAPRWVVLENVPGLLSSNDGRDMGTVLGALGDLGYGWAYRVLDAQHFGVPQRRRRVFIVAGRHLGAPDLTGPASVLLEPESLRGHLASSHTAGQGTAAGTAPSLDGRHAVAERERERERERDLSPAVIRPIRGRRGDVHDEESRSQRCDRSGGDRMIVGTLSPGAHPGGLNGQDVYAGHLVVVGE
jgi:DNA (cytosine-5)-methyltransferase 1